MGWPASFAALQRLLCRGSDTLLALRAQSVLTFDLGNAVGDVGWSPHSSTVFAAVTSDGKVMKHRCQEISVGLGIGVGSGKG